MFEIGVCFRRMVITKIVDVVMDWYTVPYFRTNFLVLELKMLKASVM
jgi:hypothetical protein